MFDPIGIETARTAHICTRVASAWISREGVSKGCPNISQTAHGPNSCKSTREFALLTLMKRIKQLHCFIYITLSPECYVPHCAG